MGFIFHPLSYIEQKPSLSGINFWHSKTWYELGWQNQPLLEWVKKTIESEWVSGYLGIVLDLKLLFFSKFDMSPTRTQYCKQTLQACLRLKLMSKLPCGEVLQAVLSAPHSHYFMLLLLTGNVYDLFMHS